MDHAHLHVGRHNDKSSGIRFGSLAYYRVLFGKMFIANSRIRSAFQWIRQGSKEHSCEQLKKTTARFRLALQRSELLGALCYRNL
jgi:hypothetical protein